MNNMFNSPSKPFYQSSIGMGLKAIPQETYIKFANRMFEERGKHIERTVTEKVYSMFAGYTWVRSNDDERIICPDCSWRMV